MFENVLGILEMRLVEWSAQSISHIFELLFFLFSFFITATTTQKEEEEHTIAERDKK